MLLSDLLVWPVIWVPNCIDRGLRRRTRRVIVDRNHAEEIYMSTRSLRILIADNRHFQRLSIEKMLNSHGYYRIAPIESIDELRAMVKYKSARFDILFMNVAIMAGRLNIEEYFRLFLNIRHVLVYNDASGLKDSGSLRSSFNVIQWLPTAPDEIALGAFLQSIDLPPPSGNSTMYV